MSEFFNVMSPLAAIDLLTGTVSLVGTERVKTENSLGRVLANSEYSDEELPRFDRSSMDGYSVRSSDTYGASDSLPAYLEMVGEIPMGQKARVSLSGGEAAIAYTGGMLAEGADAVVMIEHTKISPSGLLEVYRPVATGENVIMAGEDFRRGDLLAESGVTINHVQLGALLAVGKSHVVVRKRMKVSVISSGDELVGPDDEVTEGLVRDVNLYTIAALVKKMRATPILFPRVRDDFDQLLEVGRQALFESDVVIFTAGSSVSSRDLTSKVVNQLGEPGVLVHGLSVKPGKPTILGIAAGKLVIGLPGNPVSAVTIFNMVAIPIIKYVSGSTILTGDNSISAILDSDLHSSSGRTDYVRVKLDQPEEEIVASPVYGKSNLISTILASDGYIEIRAETTGLYKGTLVKVHLDPIG